MSQIKNSHQVALFAFGVLTVMPWIVRVPLNPGGFRANFIILGTQWGMWAIGMIGLCITLYRVHRSSQSDQAA
jgi:hypothetical protein